MQIRLGILIGLLLTILTGCRNGHEESIQNKPVGGDGKKSGQPAALAETSALKKPKDKDLHPSYEGRTIPRDAWSREDIAAILEQAKKLREHARKSFGARLELSLVFPLIQPGMRKDDVIAIVGEPNNTSLSGGPWYYLHEYLTHLVYEDGVLIDSIKDLYRRAGSKYSEISKIRALQRLAEIRPIKTAANFFDGWDLGIQTVRALGMLHDPQAVPILVDGARKAAHWVSGSESATIHGIYQQTIVDSLVRITGLPPTMKEGQDPDGLRQMAVDEQGYREILGVWIADTESEASWSDVFNELKMRGLGGVRYIVSDDHKGMRRAIDRHFQGVHCGDTPSQPSPIQPPQAV